MSTYATELSVTTTGTNGGVEVDVARNLLVPDVDGHVVRLDISEGPNSWPASVYLTEEQACLIAAALIEIVTT